MTEDEYKELKATIDRITEHEKRLTAHAHDPEDSFTPVMKGLVDLLGTVKKRITNRIAGEGPSLIE
jgi:hypothetical protein